MALWNYDPFSDFSSMVPRGMDPWGLSRMDPFSRWGEPSMSSLLSPDVYIMPTVMKRRQQQNREVISDQDKYQVRNSPSFQHYIGVLIIGVNFPI